MIVAIALASSSCALQAEQSTKQLEAEEYEEESGPLLPATLPRFLQFIDPNTPVCPGNMPIVERMEEKCVEKFEFKLFNFASGEDRAEATDYGVGGVPTYFWLKNGTVEEGMTGVVDEKEIGQVFTRLIF